MLASVALTMLIVLFFVNEYARRYVGKTRKLANTAGIILVASPIGIINVNAAIIRSNKGLCMNALPPYPRESSKIKFPERRFSMILV